MLQKETLYEERLHNARLDISCAVYMKRFQFRMYVAISLTNKPATIYTKVR